jgi:hypothetical protein
LGLFFEVDGVAEDGVQVTLQLLHLVLCRLQGLLQVLDLGLPLLHVLLLIGGGAIFVN